jgi:hypothetical protein
MEPHMSLEAFAEDGRFAPSRIATALRTTLDEVARTVGLGRDAVMRQDRIASPKTQKRLREMVEILNRVEPRFGSALIAVPIIAHVWPLTVVVPLFALFEIVAAVTVGGSHWKSVERRELMTLVPFMPLTPPVPHTRPHPLLCPRLIAPSS